MGPGALAGDKLISGEFIASAATEITVVLKRLQADPRGTQSSSQLAAGREAGVSSAESSTGL